MTAKAPAGLEPVELQALVTRLRALATAAPADPAELRTLVTRLRALADELEATGRPVLEGAWTCRVCGFVGFWYGGPHCYGDDRPPLPHRPYRPTRAIS